MDPADSCENDFHSAGRSPKGEINPGIGPSTLPVASEGQNADDADAEQYEGVNFLRHRKYIQTRPGAKIGLPIPGVPELTLEEVFLSSVFDDPDQRIWYLASKLYPGEKKGENAIRRFVWHMGVLYHRPKDGRHYLVVAPDAMVDDWLQSPDAFVNFARITGAFTGTLAGGPWGAAGGIALGGGGSEFMRQFIRS